MVAVLPHPSSAVNILVCVRLHPLLCTGPSLWVIVGALHASLAIAPSSAIPISFAPGLQPSGTVE